MYLFDLTFGPNASQCYYYNHTSLCSVQADSGFLLRVSAQGRWKTRQRPPPAAPSSLDISTDRRQGGLQTCSGLVGSWRVPMRRPGNQPIISGCWALPRGGRREVNKYPDCPDRQPEAIGTVGGERPTSERAEVDQLAFTGALQHLYPNAPAIGALYLAALRIVLPRGAYRILCSNRNPRCFMELCSNRT